MDVPVLWIGVLMVLVLVAIVLMLAVSVVMVMQIRHLRAEMFELRSAVVSVSTLTRHDIATLAHLVHDGFNETWSLWLPAASLGPSWRVYWSENWSQFVTMIQYLIQCPGNFLDVLLVRLSHRWRPQGVQNRRADRPRL